MTKRLAAIKAALYIHISHPEAFSSSSDQGVLPLENKGPSRKNQQYMSHKLCSHQVLGDTSSRLACAASAGARAGDGARAGAGRKWRHGACVRDTSARVL